LHLERLGDYAQNVYEWIVYLAIGKLKEKSIVKGHLYDHIEFWTMPETEEEFKTLLQKVLDNYS